MPITGGDPIKIGNVEGYAWAATSNATHFFVATTRGLFELAR